MSRYWVYLDSKVQGPLDVPSLRKVQGFNLLSQVCVEGEQTWRAADEVIEIKSYFLAPPRPNSFAAGPGNTAPKIDLEERPTPTPAFEELILPETKAPEPKGAAKAAGPVPLRSACGICGYKNPRDVTTCMKCGGPLETPPVGPSLAVPDAIAKINVPTGSKSLDVDLSSQTMVEIPIGKILAGIGAVALLVGGVFGVHGVWKAHHKPKPPVLAPRPAVQRPPVRRAAKPASRMVRVATRRVRGSKVAALPGVSRRRAAAQKSSPQALPAAVIPEKNTESATYRVVPEARPLQKRQPAPLNSTYAVKKRANQSLWVSQEDQAIQQVQRERIYGGQRTIERNMEILMQVLRDREYSTAFESGKRIYLYSDVDWSTSQIGGPVYEVNLTFSSGREADGTSKNPLRFAFKVDLERGTVEPGGKDQVRSNTLHAFFDESRIAPEDRRSIAKDTEEIVLAAQPGASPLNLDTVARQFVKVYGSAALARVADAYGLTAIKKKLAHSPELAAEPESAAEFPRGPSAAKPTFSSEPIRQAPSSGKALESSKAAPSESQKLAESFKENRPVQFRMESGAKRERTFLMRTTSPAAVSRIWELLTGYDRMKQFVPDMLVSEREGQDGAATIVRTTYLTRFLFFVFKINLHMRVIEHSQQHTLEFERIAGEFESFRGAVEVVTDPTTRESQILFRATVVPTGHVPNWIIEGMARRLLVNQMQAIRVKAEQQ
jgi:hypothetical protein